MQNALKSKEWWRIWVYKTFKIEMQKGGPNNFDILQNCFPEKLDPPSLICKNFKIMRKVLLNLCRMNWNLMNAKEIVSIKLLKSKYRSGDQINQTFCKIVSPQKLGSPSLICRNFKILRRVLLNHAEWIKI